MKDFPPKGGRDALDEPCCPAYVEEKGNALKSKSLITCIIDAFRRYDSWRERAEAVNNNFVLATWTRRLGKATVALAILSAITVVVLLLQLYELYEGGADTHNLALAAVTEGRAWIAAPVIVQSNCQDRKSKSGIILSFKNTGKTPTRGFVVRAIKSSVEGEGWKKQVDHLCDLPAKDIDNPYFFDYNSVVPGDESILTKSITDDDKHPFLDFPSLTEADFKGEAKPGIIGCAIYGSVYDTHRIVHHTGFIIDVTVKEHMPICADNGHSIKPD